MQLNQAARELTLKVVYYGPALSGKTTNLRALYARMDKTVRGHLMTLDTADDRTLFFDMLPLVFKTKGGMKLKLKLFTVPGQVMHNSTRRIVLQGADAIAFIADSQPTAKQTNYDYWRNMLDNLKENGLSLDQLPHVIQFNKADLADGDMDQEIARVRLESPEPVFTAQAIRGEGVAETFVGLMGITWDHLEKVHEFGAKLGLDKQSFLNEILSALPPGETGAAPASPAV